MPLSNVWIAFIFSMIVSLTVIALTSSFFGIQGVYFLFGLLILVAFGLAILDLKPRRKK